MSLGTPENNDPKIASVPLTGLENLPTDIKEIYSEVINKDQPENSTFGNGFTVEEYWTDLKGFNLDDLEQGKKNYIKSIFDELAERGLFEMNKDGSYTIAKSGTENVEESEQTEEQVTENPKIQKELKKSVAEVKDAAPAEIDLSEPEVALKTQAVEKVEATEEGEKVEGSKGWNEETERKKFEDFDRLREDLGKVEASDANFSTETGESIKQLRERYVKEKEKVSALLKKYWLEEREVSEENLSEEQKAELNSYLFEEMVIKENSLYLEAIRANREETWKDKAKIEAAKLLGNKVIKWYLGQNKLARLGINTALYSMAIGIGVVVAGGISTVAVTTAAGVAGHKIARGIGSLAGAEVGRRVGNKGVDVEVKGRKIKIWKPEDIDKWEKEEKEKIKNSENNLEEKSEKLKEIKKEAARQRKKTAVYKAALTVGMGAGAGMLTGLTENLMTNTPDTVTEIETTPKSKAVGNFGRQTLVRGPRVSPLNPPIPETFILKPVPEVGNIQPVSLGHTVESAPVETPIEPEPAIPETEVTPETPVEVTSEPEAPFEQISKPTPEVSSSTVNVGEGIFSNPEVVEHDPVAGDSIWKILRETLENNDRFHNLSGTAEEIEAKKTFVISNLTNELLKNTDQYENVGPNGEIAVGNTVNFSGLFKDSDKFNEILDKVEDLKPTQVSSIVEHNDQIETYLQENPNTKLTNDEVLKILNTKTEEVVAPGPVEAPYEPKPESTKATMPETLTTDQSPKIEGSEISMTEASGAVGVAGVGGVATGGLVVGKQKLENELVEAKNRLRVLEGGRKQKLIQKPIREIRSLSSDTEAITSGAEFEAQVEEAFREEVDDIYGKSGILGIGKVAGVDTKEWKEMARLPAKEVVEYYTDDSDKSKLPTEIINSLSKSEKHSTLMRQIGELMKRTDGTVKPYENENMEQFIKRLGGFMMKNPPQLAKAA